MNKKIQFPIDSPIPLPRQGSWPKSVHRFDPRSGNAVNAALAARRPLLIRGNPGTGKSQLARAAAHFLGRMFVAQVVHARAESQDLLYHFDAVGRLGEAQALGTGCHDPKIIEEKLNPRRYLAPGALWWVFDWESALEQSNFTSFKHQVPEQPTGWNPGKGSVLLIDEIDKADADLPNGLLETLGNGGFSVPSLDKPVRVQDELLPPLVIITTNEERELPDAFVRRCLVLHLHLPDESPAYRDKSEQEKGEAVKEELISRGRDHFPAMEKTVLKEAADQLWKDRAEARLQGITPPGQAEYLDLLRALDELADNEQSRIDLLFDIKEFVLQKRMELF